jgi:WD40 repeat protein
MKRIAHTGPVSGVATFGDQWIGTAGYDNRVVLWDGQTNEPVAETWHSHLANYCAFHPAGSLLATASSDYTAQLHSVPNLTLRATLRGHTDDVEAVAFSPRGCWVATACRDGFVRIFDLSGNLVRNLEGHTADVLSVQFLDEHHVISSGDDGTVRLWSLETGTWRVLASSNTETDAIAVGPGGCLYAGNDAGEVVLLCSGDRRPVRAHRAGVKRLVFDARAGRLVSLGYDRRVCIWQCASDGSLTLLDEIEAPAVVWMRTAAVTAHGRLVFGTFGSSYATYDVDRRTWDVERVSETPCLNAVIVRDGRIWTIGDAGIARVDGAEKSRVGSLCNFLLAWGDRIITAGQTGAVLDLVHGVKLHGHTSPLNCACTLPGERVAIGAYTGEVLIFRAVPGSPEVRLEKILEAHPNAIKGLACDGETLFSVCATGAAAAHDPWTGATRWRRLDAHERIANGVAVVDPGIFATVSRDRCLRIWRGPSCDVYPSPHAHSIKCVAACRTTGRIATGSYGGTIALFESGRWTSCQRPTTAGISSLAWTGSPGAFVASSYDGNVYEITAEGAINTSFGPH